jgi:hypothetical protein
MRLFLAKLSGGLTITLPRLPVTTKPNKLRATLKFGAIGMPEKKTIERARKDKQEGKAPSTQAGEFVREEMEHIWEGKHGARSP